jgi:ceramide glucosyltransferase
MTIALGWLGWGLAAAALAGTVYTIAAAILIGRYRAAPIQPDTHIWPAITVLKPLCGAEPRLADNLETLARQDYPAPVQIVFGVSDPADPAAVVAAALARRHPDADIRLVIDPAKHGSNHKVANLINMAGHITHPLVVISDSDVALPPGALRRLAQGLADPGAGLVSCFHVGRGDSGFWSVMVAMDISYRFMPSVAVAVATGLGHPALGPTMALRRTTLGAIGGFAPFADVLADDYEIGRAVRALGLTSAVPRFAITHCGTEASLAEALRHELRWTRTIYAINPAGFAGSGVTHCLPLACFGVLLTGFAPAALLVLGAAAAARLFLACWVDHVTGHASGPKLWLLVSDFLAFAVYLATFFVDRIDWRGIRFHVASDGRMSAEQE